MTELDKLRDQVDVVRSAIPDACCRVSPDHTRICVRDIGHAGDCFVEEDEVIAPVCVRCKWPAMYGTKERPLCYDHNWEEWAFGRRVADVNTGGKT